jgi:hypothetical protein
MIAFIGASYISACGDRSCEPFWACRPTSASQHDQIWAVKPSLSVGGGQDWVAAVGTFGQRARFDVDLRPGWWQSRFLIGGLAAVADAQAHGSRSWADCA